MGNFISDGESEVVYEVVILTDKSHFVASQESNTTIDPLISSDGMGVSHPTFLLGLKIKLFKYVV